MTCLSIIQTVCRRIGLTQPNAAVGSTDQQIINILELVNEEGQELAFRAPWTVLQKEATFTTLAAEDQGAMSSIASDLNYIINDTIWNRSLRRPIFGPRAPQQWQQNKAFAINGPWSNFRIMGGNLRMYPTPTAGETCYFEYISKNWCMNGGGTTYSSFQADTNTTLLDEQIIVLGTVWRWKKLKGFEYGEDFNAYERRVTDSIARDGSRDFLSLTNTKYDIFPGVVVPSGSWNL